MYQFFQPCSPSELHILTVEISLESKRMDSMPKIVVIILPFTLIILSLRIQCSSPFFTLSIFLIHFLLFINIYYLSMSFFFPSSIQIIPRPINLTRNETSLSCKNHYEDDVCVFLSVTFLLCQHTKGLLIHWI